MPKVISYSIHTVHRTQGHPEAARIRIIISYSTDCSSANGPKNRWFESSGTYIFCIVYYYHHIYRQYTGKDDGQ